MMHRREPVSGLISQIQGAWHDCKDSFQYELYLLGPALVLGLICTEAGLGFDQTGSQSTKIMESRVSGPLSLLKPSFSERCASPIQKDWFSCVKCPKWLRSTPFQTSCGPLPFGWRVWPSSRSSCSYSRSEKWSSSAARRRFFLGVVMLEA